MVGQRVVERREGGVGSAAGTRSSIQELPSTTPVASTRGLASTGSGTSYNGELSSRALVLPSP